jgi:hypothetical protein
VLHFCREKKALQTQLEQLQQALNGIEEQHAAHTSQLEAQHAEHVQRLLQAAEQAAAAAAEQGAAQVELHKAALDDVDQWCTGARATLLIC